MFIKVSTQIHQMVKTKRILIKLKREKQIAINFWWLCVQHKGIINLKTPAWRFQIRSNVFKYLACDYNVIWTELRYYSLASIDTSIIISLAFRVYAGMTFYNGEFQDLATLLKIHFRWSSRTKSPIIKWRIGWVSRQHLQCLNCWISRNDWSSHSYYQHADFWKSK